MEDIKKTGIGLLALAVLTLITIGFVYTVAQFLMWITVSRFLYILGTMLILTFSHSLGDSLLKK